jgi:hypothetical protein
MAGSYLHGFLLSGDDMNNRNLHKARSTKNDEFYTRLVDIENELKHYHDHFKGKVVYCNCDTGDSNFVKYFQDNFESLGLRKLIHTSNDFRKNLLHLKAADIVVTNPPFSLFREFIALLVEHKKQFLVVGNMNAITYKEIFPLIKDNKLWTGFNFNKTMDFALPAHYEKYKYVKEGVKYGSVPAIVWYTNLPHQKRTEEQILFRNYDPKKYPKYDNYDAIEVSKVVDIPCNYAGIMGVPITFLGKYNPNQFEIIWVTDRGGDGYLDHIKKQHNRYDAPVVNDKGLYKRIFIRRR